MPPRVNATTGATNPATMKASLIEMSCPCSSSTMPATDPIAIATRAVNSCANTPLTDIPQKWAPSASSLSTGADTASMTSNSPHLWPATAIHMTWQVKRNHRMVDTQQGDLVIPIRQIELCPIAARTSRIPMDALALHSQCSLEGVLPIHCAAPPSSGR
jgi:hypothetical protein